MKWEWIEEIKKYKGGREEEQEEERIKASRSYIRTFHSCRQTDSSRPENEIGTEARIDGEIRSMEAVSYTHLRGPRDLSTSRMPSSA